MDTWAPVVRYAHEGVGYWTNDAGTLSLNTTAGAGNQCNLRPAGAGADTAAHDVTGNQWTNAYGEATIFPNNFSGNTGRRAGVWLRVASSSNCYTVVFDGGSGGNGNITISKVVAGTPTSLATGTFPIGDLTSYITIRAEIQDDIIRAFWRGQLILTTRGDTTFTDPGFVSMYLRASTTAADMQAIRWEAGPLTGRYAASHTPQAGQRRAAGRFR